MKGCCMLSHSRQAQTCVPCTVQNNYPHLKLTLLINTGKICSKHSFVGTGVGVSELGRCSDEHKRTQIICMLHRIRNRWNAG